MCGLAGGVKAGAEVKVVVGSETMGTAKEREARESRTTPAETPNPSISARRASTRLDYGTSRLSFA